MTSKRRRKTATPASVYELKITLKDSKPPIGRRVAVAGNTALRDLHEVIQIVMGWTNSHLHQFIVPNSQPQPTREEINERGRSGRWEKLAGLMRRDRTISDPAFELEDAEDESAITLEELAPAVKSKFIYGYDFGDGWDHQVEVVKIGPPGEGAEYPTCLKGKRACPPEDCGGIWGYYELLEALRDPRHERHEESAECLGEDFHPERFDLEEVNAALAGLR